MKQHNSHETINSDTRGLFSSTFKQYIHGTKRRFASRFDSLARSLSPAFNVHSTFGNERERNRNVAL